ncbi:carbohydrate ABC transporter permease [Deinococcus peraridilitoris]|uniref:Permease component of ABC-type sugar transporter n=1 Tax=Deinococcus peraridilitoris (strain DSM 19664 / LMG 22246 / CIP 109416 / KR-200) TaxID=937777 RepID=K9ZZW1_DEIPD|nr:sugar ABC transporter permease [Deinococcus peraridilitoris]AFZ66477.1 permease component of ABC-type sugar transporter [Deinococcus peraridilitoris DSM 19664]
MSLTAPRMPRRHGFNDANPVVPYLYLLPFALFFLVFVVYPVGFGFYVSLHRFDLLSETTPFVGLEYYRALFNFDTPQAQFFWQSMRNTTFFTVVSVPLLIATALGLALLLNRPIFGRSFFRAVFFLPGVLTVSVMGILWRWMFDNQIGLVNAVRGDVFGLQPLAFLSVEQLAWVPIIVGTLWWTIGFNMTLYLAALGNISTSYYEAADIDGATPWAKFRFITWPLLGPVTLFVFVTTVLASFQLFGQSLLITAGGPNRSTQSAIMYITEEAFTNNQFSSATAMSFMFGLVMLIFTYLQFRIMARDARGG